MADSVIELGPRTNSMVELINRKFLPADARFLYVDNEKTWLTKLKRSVAEKGRVLLGDATKLPVPPNSTDTVFAKDLFGHFGTPEYIPGKGFTGKDIGDAMSAQKVANEMGRVLKPGGSAVILETVTPYNRAKLIQEFKNAGFDEKNMMVYPRDRIKEIYDDKDVGEAFTSSSDPSSYAVVFKKS